MIKKFLFSTLVVLIFAFGFLGVSIVIPGLTDSMSVAYAFPEDSDCCDSGGFSWFDWYYEPTITHLDGGGGGGGYEPPEPYCTLTITQGYVQSASYPPITEYILTWSAPYATSFSINNGVGLVTPTTGGTHSIYLSSNPGVYTGTAVTPYGTVNCSTTPLPPAPICTLDLTKDKITWTTTNATSVVIVPLTNSPQVPGGSCTLNSNPGSSVQVSESTLYNSQAVTSDLNASGVSTYISPSKKAGFAADPNTLNRLCQIVHPGSTADYSASGKRGYDSPSNDYIVRYVNGAWVKVSATTYNSHVSGYIVCNVPAAPQCQLSGMHTFVPPLGVGTHTYKLTATGPGGSVMCEDTIVIEEPKECELTISKTANKTIVEPGEYIEYTINFKNVGDAKCTGSGVKVVDVLDPGLTFISETHSSNIDAGYITDPVYTSSDRTVRFNAWDLDPNESGWAKIKVKANNPSQCTSVIPNKAKITSLEYNNFTQWVESAVVNVTVDKGCTPPPECKLQITKTTESTFVEPGEYIEYLINFKNVGGKKCTGSGVLIKDTLDQYLEYVSETHSSNIDAGYLTDPVYKSSDRTVRFNAWDLDPNESGWAKIKVKALPVPQCLTLVHNVGKITAYEYNNFQTYVTSNIASVTIDQDCTPPPTECKLEISKSANKTNVGPYDEVEYTINFKNAGGKNCTGDGVKLIDVVDERLEYKSETHSSNVTSGYVSEPVYNSSTRTLTWNAGTLTPGEEGWVKFKVKTKKPTTCSETVPNKAKITAKEYSNFSEWVESNVVNLTLSKDCEPPPTKCELEITKSVDDETVEPYDVIEYTINFENVGGKVCTGAGVKVTDVLDNRLTYQSNTRSSNVAAGYQSTPVYDSSNRTVTFNAFDLDPGEKGWVKIKAKVGTPSQCSEVIPNKARITSKEYNNFTTYEESNRVDVTVQKDCNVPPPYCTMSINPTTINGGESATLTWNSSNVNTVSIDQGVGSVSTSGTKVVSPNTNTTYTGTFTGPGGTVTCNATVTVNSPNPVCTLTLSKTSIKPGESTVLSWTSTHASAGSANGNVGNLTPVGAGSMEIFPSDDFTYVATFTGPHGNVSCQATVDVQTTTSGCRPGSCPGGLNQPTTVMFQKPGDQPLAFVYLSQIPYTGFEAGPALTFIFWLTVALIAALGAYYIMGQGGLRYVMGYVSGFAGIPTEEEIEDAEARARERSQVYGTPYPEVAPVVVNESTLAIPARAPIPMPAASAVMPKTPQPSVDGVPALSDVIESRAHASGVLISPEAVEMAEALSGDRAEALRMFGEILNEAVRTIAREDGWVMLTSDRFEKLAGTAKKQVVEKVPVNSVLQPMKTYTIGGAQPASTPATVDDAAATAFAGALLSGDRETAFSIIRSLEHDNVSPVTLMTATASVLDRLYRARKGGQNGVDASLYAKAAAVSDENLHKLVEVVTHSLDPLYTNPFTGVKLALAQAFELLG